MESIPSLGFGSYRHSLEDAYNFVSLALKLGYRHIDTAHIYKNEEAVGQAIRDSGIPRSEIWVTTKVWKKFIEKDKIADAVDTSLKKLGLDYLDLVLIHSPCKGKYVTSWQLLEKYVAENPGRVRQIGVSNYRQDHLEALEKVWKIKPYCNQIEVTPFFRREELVSWCKNKGIIVVAHSSLTRGQKLDHEIVTRVAEKNKASVSQILLGWAREKELVLIPGASTEEHLMANWEGREFVLDNSGVVELDSISDEFALFPWFG